MKAKKKKFHRIDTLSKFLAENGVSIGVMPDDGGFYVSIKDGWFQGGGYFIGADPIENNVFRKRQPFHFARKAITEYSSCSEVKNEDFCNDDIYIRAESGRVDEIRGYDGLNIGDVVGIMYGAKEIVYDDETGEYVPFDPDKHADLDCDETTLDGKVNVVVYLGENRFIDARDVNQHIFKALKTLAILYTNTDLKPIGLRFGELYGFKD